MATSGSIDLRFDARACITFALRKLGVLAVNQSPTAAQADGATLELNLMLKGWSKYQWLWRLTEGSITLAANDYDYTLSPVPNRVVSARYRNSSGTDLPMALLTREEYYAMPLKTGSGSPTQFYVDYQRDSPTLLIWQGLASVTTETIKYTYQRKFEDIDSLDNDMDVRQEHFEVVAYNLADRLGADYGRVGAPRHAYCSAKAKELLEEALDADREDEVRFVPEMAGWY